jgi:predicted CXXCH cytochrome family protein
VYWKPTLAIIATIVLAASLDTQLTANLAVSDSSKPSASSFSAQSCVQCHSQSNGLNHPVGVLQSQAVDLPLAAGKIDCLTCHNEQATSPMHAEKSGNRKDNMLRQPANGLCQSCHQSDLLADDGHSRISHGIAMRKAHYQDTDSSAKRVEGRLDSETRECLSCHDGSAANHSGVRDAGLGPDRSVATESMHPIGVRYSTMARPNQTPQFRAVSGLPNTVRLFDGKLGCGSCHSIYSEEKQMMAVDMKRSKLCLSCHIK